MHSAHRQKVERMYGSSMNEEGEEGLEALTQSGRREDETGGRGIE